VEIPRIGDILDLVAEEGIGGRADELASPDDGGVAVGDEEAEDGVHCALGFVDKGDIAPRRPVRRIFVEAVEPLYPGGGVPPLRLQRDGAPFRVKGAGELGVEFVHLYCFEFIVRGFGRCVKDLHGASLV